MAFPHPQSGENQEREKDEPRGTGVLGEARERAVHIPRDGDSQDHVQAAKNGTFGGWGHEEVLL